MRKFFLHSALPLALCLVCLTAGCAKKSPQEMLGEAQQFLQNNDTYGAQITFQKILDQQPEPQVAMDARMGLAMCYANQNDYKSAREQIDTVIKDVGGPQTEAGFQAWNLKVMTYAQEQDYKGAIAEIEATSPTLAALPLQAKAQIQSHLASLYLSDKQPEKAMAIANHLFEMTRNDQELHASLMGLVNQILGSEKKWPEMVAFYQDYIQRFPQSKWLSLAYFNLGVTLDEAGRKPEAEQAYAQSETLLQKQIADALGADEKSQLMMELSGLYQQRGMMAEAIATLDKVVTDYPASAQAPMALLFQANIAASQGNLDHAVTILQQIQAQYPAAPAAQQAQQFMAGIERVKAQGGLTRGTLQQAQPTTALATQAMPTADPTTAPATLEVPSTVPATQAEPTTAPVTDAAPTSAPL